MVKIGERLKELRQEKNLTQTELAKNIGLSQAGIAKWETGDREPSADCIILLAQYFDVTTDFLLGVEDRDLLKHKK